MANKLELYRESLQTGNLYYLDEKIKGKFSDSVNIWKVGPSLKSFLGQKDEYIDVLYMNMFNPFVLLEIQNDSDLITTYWYKVLTIRGRIGWFILDDEDTRLLHICFRHADIPDDGLLPK